MLTRRIVNATMHKQNLHHLQRINQSEEFAVVVLEASSNPADRVATGDDVTHRDLRKMWPQNMKNMSSTNMSPTLAIACHLCIRGDSSKSRLDDQRRFRRKRACAKPYLIRLEFTMRYMKAINFHVHGNQKMAEALLRPSQSAAH